MVEATLVAENGRKLGCTVVRDTEDETLGRLERLQEGWQEGTVVEHKESEGIGRGRDVVAVEKDGRLGLLERLQES